MIKRLKTPPGLAGLVLCLVIGGCSDQVVNTFRSGQPDFDTGLLMPTVRSSDGKTTMLVSGATGTTPGAALPAAPLQPQSCVENNTADCIWDLKSLIDNAYGGYKIALRQIIDGGNTGADLAVLGLAAGITATPGASVKTLLAAIQTGIAGGKSAVDSDMIYKQSVGLIINQMDKDRATIEAAIINHVNNDGSRYTLSHARNDLLDYFNAGTFTHALASLQNSTATASAACQAQAVAAKAGGSATPPPDASGNCAPPPVAAAKPGDGLKLEQASGTMKSTDTAFTIKVTALSATTRLAIASSNQAAKFDTITATGTAVLLKYPQPAITLAVGLPVSATDPLTITWPVSGLKAKDTVTISASSPDAMGSVAVYTETVN